MALLKRLEDARTRLVQLRSSHDNQQITAARKEVDRLLKKVAAYPGLGLYAAQMEKFQVSPEYMEQLANAPTSRTTARHPAQLYASFDGMLLAILLNAVFYRRQRHGVVFCLLLMIYPFMRICEEIIRSDNPHDTAGLTISQFVSLVIVAVGLGCWLLYRRLPLRSPRAIPWIPPEQIEKSKKHQKPR